MRCSWLLRQKGAPGSNFKFRSDAPSYNFVNRLSVRGHNLNPYLGDRVTRYVGVASRLNYGISNPEFLRFTSGSYPAFQRRASLREGPRLLCLLALGHRGRADLLSDETAAARDLGARERRQALTTLQG